MSSAFYPLGMNSMPASGYNHGSTYYNKQYINIKAKLISAWETFKDKIIPAVIISFIYYFIWFIFFKIIPAIFKYMFAVLQQFKQP